MIPILYEKTETAFTSNGLGRLRDCISCVVTEERNGIYECDFEYPVGGQNYELIQIGRIIGVTHEESSDIQPFDIVSFSKPIDGIVTFHCTHISYRQSYMTIAGSNINSLSGAFTLLSGAKPLNPFAYQTDMTKSGFLACADGIPRTVRQMLGGIEGSILDTYGGEYEWDKWTVKLMSSRGSIRDLTIRYGVNMLSYNDEMDASESYTSCMPYWTDGEQTVYSSTTVDSGGVTPMGREQCIPLDLSDKFETKPTAAQLRTAAASYMSQSRPYLPAQTINVSFAQIHQMAGYEDFEDLFHCHLCDTIKVIFPDYSTNGYFKIVKTIWNVLGDNYDEMELGTLSTSLSDALGISISPEKSTSGGSTFEDITVTNDASIGNDLTVGGTGTFTGDVVTDGAVISGLDIISGGEVTDGNGNTLSNKADKTDVKNVSFVDKAASTGSISSGGYKNLAVTPTAPTGKTLKGCAGIHMEGTNSSYCQLIGFYINGSAIQVQMKNTSSGSVTWTCTVTGIYQ